mgnify:FL=1
MTTSAVAELMTQMGQQARQASALMAKSSANLRSQALLRLAHLRR